MPHILPIALRQFRSYFNGPVAYVVAVIVLFCVGFMFWMSFFLAGRATASAMFEWIGYSMVFAIPPITMGLVAEERESGTLEVLMTLPVRDSEVILGKFLGTLGLLTVIILITLVNPIAVATLGDLDWGPVITGYIGAFLLTAAMLAFGLMVSAWMPNQILAFFFSFLLLIPVGWIVPAVLQVLASGWHSEGWFWDTAATVLEFISPQEHLESMTRGVIDTRDLVYFLSAITFGLLAAFRGLESRRWS
jgi:ABC-2 type transport system permease protein